MKLEKNGLRLQMKPRWLLKLGIVAGLLLYLTSCASKIILHPVYKEDFWITDESGNIVEFAVPEGTTYHMSEKFFTEVMEIKAGD